jgi:ParB family protein of integrating conjugative element (PFGI_1 class)
MADPTPPAMAGKFLTENFTRSSPTTQALSDPLCDTTIVLTLNELRPYELNPRIMRNPLYEEIKASIRERGLDAPPPITRRPGADHYIIRNGGNTRLSILRELWSETRDERFFRSPCLVRPWPERGEIVALTGHLAENELHGGLSFIERALGVEKARELYEQEGGKLLSQSELARRLSADGYPVPQPHISRMRDAVRYLLPAIPNILYGGLGRPQVERLITLRRTGEAVWERHALGKSLNIDFETLFYEALSPFDLIPAKFSVSRAQDELVERMAKWLGINAKLLDLDIGNIEDRQNTIVRPQETEHATRSDPPENEATYPQEHVVSPVASIERLQTTRQGVAEHTDEVSPNFAENVSRVIPVQADEPRPITDLWRIEPNVDTPAGLRRHIAQLAREIAGEAGLSECIVTVGNGIGFVCTLPSSSDSFSDFGHALLSLLCLLSGNPSSAFHPTRADLPLESLGALLQGRFPPGSEPRLSDSGLVKFFRLLRLSRRLLDIEAGPDNSGH